MQVNWSYPTTIWFGAGRSAAIAEACLECGLRNPLVVTDRGLRELPFVGALTDRIRDAGLEVAIFSEVDPNPHEGNLAEGLKAYRDGGHDGVIALGGGSGLDLGKLVAFMAGQTLSVWDFEDIGDWWTRADADAIAPIIAVPTTAGTGSEVGRAGVLTNSETHEKKIIFHPKILPSIVVADPELTVGLPPAITAGTGMDALAHCLEAYCSPHYHPMSQGIALEGIRLVFENLTNAFNNPTDLVARGHMMSAAMMGAVAFQKGLGAIHALSHPIGAHFGTHHGTTNAVFMPHVLRFNRHAIEARIETAAAYLGISGGFEGFLSAVEELNSELGIPANLKELGVDSPDLERLIEDALKDPSTGGNPVEMTNDNTRELYLAAL